MKCLNTKLRNDIVVLRKQRIEAIYALDFDHHNIALATKVDDLGMVIRKKIMAGNPDALVRTLSGKWADDGGTVFVSKSRALKSKLAEAGQHIRNLIHPDIRPRGLGVKVMAKGRRAYYNSSTKTAHIASNAKMRTPLHEAVHALEFDHPDILKKTTAFLKKRAGKDGLTKYNGELGYSDKWVERGGNQYTGRDYSVVTEDGVFTTATEILTMGVERLIKDPLAFAQRDPEYFNFIMGIFRNVR